jgi:hypothetical protein
LEKFLKIDVVWKGEKKKTGQKEKKTGEGEVETMEIKNSGAVLENS